MNNYIEHAHRTSAPVEPVMDRLAANPQSLTHLFLILTHIARWASVLDKWKAWAYYGKGFPPLAIIDAPDLDSFSPLLLEKALEVIADMHFLEIAHAIIGLSTEAGEMAEALIPAMFNGLPLDVPNLHEESGDITWYLAKLFHFTNTDFERVMATNIRKLKSRYPEKFDAKLANERDLHKEREAMLALQKDKAED